MFSKTSPRCEITNSTSGSIINSATAESRIAALYVRLTIILSLSLAACPTVYGQQASKPKPTPTGVEQTSRPPQIYKAEGISVEFSFEPASSEKRDSTELVAGEDAIIRFKIRETSGGKGLGNLRPAVWIDQRQNAAAPLIKECREKIQSFLQPSFAKRPTIDLNSYFILALNDEPNISVIDPLAGFGGSKLFTLINLRSSGEDWAMSADRKRLYVSMPEVNQLAVIDIPTWKVITNVDAGVKPMRVALQHDGRYLWIGNDGSDETTSGITVFDTVALKVVAHIGTGMGHHELAFNDDDSAAFVTNKQDGTLSVIDVRRLAKTASIKVGSRPAAVAFSSLSKAVYVVNEGDGNIVAVGGERFGILARISAEPGLSEIRIPPDGGFGFVINQAKSRLYVFDLSSNRLAHTVPVGPASDQITFTKQFAYVRSTGSEFVTMLKIADLGKETALSRFPAGQEAPKKSPATSLADAIVAAPEEGSVLVANPADKMIYYYTEGMAAPMGSFQNYRREPKALLVLDNSLRETEPGVYTITLRLPAAGQYDVPFLLDSPRVVNCFHLPVAENPALPKPTGVTIKIEPLANRTTVPVDQRYTLRFKVIDAATNLPRGDLEDVGVLVFLAPGIWQQRETAKHVGGGIYEMNFVPPQAGVYYVYFQCPSLGIHYNQITPLTLQAVKLENAPGGNN
jgi:YVTN family beta-propeller protein